MTPGEVGSLQQLAAANGGSLTMNPETGLPEAGFLSDILPAIAGIGLSFVPSIGPLAAGLLVGGGTALATKDLGRGLTAGLGAFGGAGLGSGLQGMSALTKVPAAGAGLKSAISSNAASFGSGTKQALTSGFGNFMPANAGAGLIGTGGMGATKAGLTALTPMLMSSMRPAPFRPVQSPEFDPYYGGPYKFKEGPVRFPTNEELLDDDTSEFSYFDYQYPQQYAEGGEVGEKMYFPPEYFNTAVPVMAGNTGIERIQNAIRSPGGLYGLVNPAFNAQAEANQARWGQVQQYLRPAGSTGWGYGEIRAAHDKLMEAENPQAPSAKAQSPRFNPVGFNPGSPYFSFAEGGMTDGRYLKGPGDGMSDDIPATIDHENGEQQPARLAAGEFVVPADVVSHLGNGDSDSGAQKLYAMMDRVRRARTGKTDQAPEVDTDKMLPA